MTSQALDRPTPPGVAHHYLFYPGCSMESSATAYRDSLDAVLEPLAIHLEEIEDWNCCGATEYVGISLTPAYALIARNLALAAGQADGSHTLVASCSACYLNLAKADLYMQESAVLAGRVNDALGAGGLAYRPGSLTVRHLLEVIISDIGLEAVRAAVVRPLAGLRVAPYLGCMVPRPDPGHRWTDHERPRELDLLLGALGADVVEYPLKTECCGGHMTQISPPVGFELIRRLVAGAEQVGADLMVTLCPMCQINVDAYQGEMNRYFGSHHRMPILFFTQLMGLAFGRDAADLGIGRELVDARPALARIGLEVPAVESTEEQKAARIEAAHRRKQALPMPPMPDQQETRR